jgi:tight adherence protein B
MDTANIILTGVIFFFSVSIIMFLYYLWIGSKFAEKQLMKRRLLYISAGGKHGRQKLALYQERVLKDAGVFERLAFTMPRFSRLDSLLLKSGISISVTGFVAICIACACIGFLAAYRLLPPAGIIAAIVIGFTFAIIPYLYLLFMEAKFLKKFDEQLPEALDLLSRALRSGYAIASGFELIAEEMENPIRSEFRATVDEINLGLPVQDAFHNLCERVPSTDLKFFAIAILIQRETGGNVAEILDRIGRLIRERLQFNRQVQALTAEGRLSAWVLILLPVVMFIYMFFVNYEYISLLWTHKAGLLLIALGLFLQVIGALFIKKIVNIDI